jgi:hypothetical protein
MEKMSGRKLDYHRDYTGEDFDRLYDMLKKVCAEKFHFKVVLNDEAIRTNISHDDKKGYYSWTCLDGEYYIDHQSASSEGECMEMFESEDALYNFLRFQESYIRGGNDNG